jgi:hypothetical protein
LKFSRYSAASNPKEWKIRLTKISLRILHIAIRQATGKGDRLSIGSFQILSSRTDPVRKAAGWGHCLKSDQFIPEKWTNVIIKMDTATWVIKSSKAVFWKIIGPFH